MQQHFFKFRHVLWLSLFVAFLSTTTAFAQSRGLALDNAGEEGQPLELYKASYALVLGNSDYTAGWPDLPGVKEDVETVKTALETNGFEVVLEQNLTRSGLDQAFMEFINQYGQEPQNRLLFYYAGHGHTLKLAYGGEMGYLVPVDAPNPNQNQSGFLANALDMQQIEVYAKRIQAKHALFLFDSCFSGSIFALSRAVPESISYKTAEPVRQFITSGSAAETVPDESIFRQQLVAALKGGGDLNDDGYVTGTELGEFLQNNVVNYSKAAQHPQYGKIRDPFLDKGDFVFEIPRARSIAPEKPTAATETKRPACVTAQTAYPPLFPYALINSMESGDFPYWFYVTVNNACSEELLFDIGFDLLRGPAVINAEKKMVYKVAAGKTFAQSIPFPIDFSKPDVDDQLIVTWTIQRNEDQTIFDQGTASITVLPKSRYCWDLINFDGQPVSQEFLLASLTAWSQSADANLKKLAQELLQGVTEPRDRVLRIRQWLERCYALFQGDNAIEVTPFDRQFPPEECWDIYAPVRVLEERLGDPLEASLLIGALAQSATVYKRLGVQMLLLIAPAGAERTEQMVCLAWPAGGQVWQAVNLAQANTQPFEENLNTTSAQLNAILSATPDVLQRLAETGIFIQSISPVYAVDLVTAAKKFRIRALP